MPEGPPPDCGLTVSAAAAVVLRPSESVTVTATAKLPVAAGVQANMEVSAEEQPAGSPEYAYDKGALPPVAVAVKVTLDPKVTVDEETENELIVGPVDAKENAIA